MNILHQFTLRDDARKFAAAKIREGFRTQKIEYHGHIAVATLVTEADVLTIRCVDETPAVMFLEPPPGVRRRVTASPKQIADVDAEGVGDRRQPRHGSPTVAVLEVANHLGRGPDLGSQ